jgi:probable F420-dependent oxidoreductase
MRFLINLPNCMHVSAMTQPWERDLTGPDIVGVARTAEELGFSGVFLPEHFMTPLEHLEASGNHYFHASTALGFLAGATETIPVGSMLNVLPLQHPLITAKAIATLDWLSGGRAFATFGVGWLKQEFDVIGVPFHRRGQMADEYMEALLELWESDKPTYDGEFVSFQNMAFGPKPVQRPHPPLWFGGDADAVLRRAARFGNGWVPWQTRPADLPARIDYLKSRPEYDDRPFAVFYSVALAMIGEEHSTLATLDASRPTAEQVIDQCGRMAELGVTDTWVPPPAVAGVDAYLDHMRWVAEEVAPKVR